MTRRVALALASLLLAFAAGRVSATPRSAPIIPAGPVGVSEPDQGQSEPSDYTPATPAPVVVSTGKATQLTNAPAANVSPGPTANLAPVSTRLAGTASWYCRAGRSACTAGYGPDCACAAAGAALQVGDWRGRVVTVCAGSCIRVALVDTMAHPGRLVDLYASQFSRLAPLSAGLVAVVIALD